MSQPIKTVNMFGPIGGTDYLKQTLANKFKSKLKGNSMLTAMGTNPIPGQAQPQQVSKNAGQMHPRFSSNGGVASLSATGTMRIPNIDSDRQVLKAAMEKLISGGTYDDELVDKTAFLGVALKAAPLVGRLGMGAWRMASGAAKAAPAAARAGAKAFGTTGNTTGQSVSAATSAAGRTMRAGAAKADRNAYRATRWAAGEAKDKLGPAAGTIYNRGAAGLQGTLYGAGVDTGASILGYDTGGAGMMLGGAGGVIGSRPLRMLRYRMLGGPGANVARNRAAGTALSTNVAPRTFGQKLVGTGDDIAASLKGLGQRHAGKLHGLTTAGVVGGVQRMNSGGVVDATDPVGTFRRGQEFARDNAARGFGYEGGYDEMTQDISPVVQDIRRTLDEHRQQQAVVPQGQDLRQLVRDQRANPF